MDFQSWWISVRILSHCMFNLLQTDNGLLSGSQVARTAKVKIRRKNAANKALAQVCYTSLIVFLCVTVWFSLFQLLQEMVVFGGFSGVFPLTLPLLFILFCFTFNVMFIFLLPFFGRKIRLDNRLSEFKFCLTLILLVTKKYNTKSHQRLLLNHRMVISLTGRRYQ